MFFIQMSGIPGTGKSTLAKAISENFDIVIVDHDTTKTALLEKLDSHLSNKILGQVSYHLDWEFIESLLIQNKNIIFDSPCLYSEIVEKGMDLARKYGYTYKYIECINENFMEVEERLSSRKSKLSQISKYKSYDIFVQALNGSKRPNDDNYIIVNSSKKIESYLSDVMDYIQE